MRKPVGFPDKCAEQDSLEVIGVSKVVYRGIEDVALRVLLRLGQVVSFPATVLAPVRSLRTQYGTRCHLIAILMLVMLDLIGKLNLYDTIDILIDYIKSYCHSFFFLKLTNGNCY